MGWTMNRTMVAAFAGMTLVAGSLPAAAVTGTAVGSLVTSTQVGLIGTGPVIGPGSIKYFIPLGTSSGTYGVGNGCSGTGFGTCADSGSGGGTLTMFLRFAPIVASASNTLKILFEDLDLSGVNDPTGFLESLQIFDSANNPLTALITAIGGLVTGNSNSQTLTLALGALPASPLYLQLKFKASYNQGGTNTAEYLKADVSQVPIPPALLLLGSALTGLGFLSRGKKRKSSLT